MKFNSKDDGITHINVYSKSKTVLGKFCSNFANTPFDCEDGHFESIEGYWYWLSIDSTLIEREKLRTLHSYAAKKVGQFLNGKDYPNTNQFKEKIKKAIKIKFENNKDIFEEFKKSKLPLAHYYVSDDDKMFHPINGWWVIEYLESLRDI